MAAAAIPFVLAGLSALGGLFGNRKSTATSTQRGTQTTDRTMTQMPTYDPRALAMRDSLMSAFMGRLGPNFASGLAGDITTGNIQNINRGAASQRRLLEQSLAARGMNYGPLGAVLGNEADSDRISQVVQALNQRRLLAEQIQSGNLAGASEFFRGLPVGSTATDKGTVTTDMTGTSTQPGNMLGGLFGGLGTSLGGMYGATGGFGKYPAWGGSGGVQGTDATTNIDDLVNSILLGGSGKLPGAPPVSFVQNVGRGFGGGFGGGSLLGSLINAFSRRG